MRRFLIWSAISVVIGAVVATGGYWAYNHFFLRWQPVPIEVKQAEIQKLLDGSGYVSPGRQGPWVYVVRPRDCAECTRYQREEFPKLDAADVDTRVIVVVPEDVEGQPARSTAEERTTVAELWLNRDWALYQAFSTTPKGQWTAQGLRPADGDIARTAVVDASRKFVADLRPLLRENGFDLAYPVVIWRDAQGRMKACACRDERQFKQVREDLGAPDAAPPPSAPEPETPAAPPTAEGVAPAAAAPAEAAPAQAPTEAPAPNAPAQAAPAPAAPAEAAPAPTPTSAKAEPERRI